MHISEELHGMNTWDMSIFTGGDETNWCSDNKNITYKVDIKTKLGERVQKHRTFLSWTPRPSLGFVNK